MGLRLVLDTNAVISLQKGMLMNPLPVAQYFVSVVTEIELLSYSELRPDHERALRQFLNDVTVIGIDPEVKESAIALRRAHRLRIPDAIVAATAVTLDADLITNDSVLAHTPGLRSRSLALRSP